MVDFYSEHYSALIGDTGHFTTLSSPVPAVPVGNKHARLRRTVAHFNVPSGQDLADNDVIRVLDLRSSDRVQEILVSSDANWGATSDFNIGLYEKGTANNGAVIDENLFADSIDWSGAIARVDYFNGAGGSLDDWDRGKPLWFLADIGGGTYSVDPIEAWTLAFTAEGNPSASAALVEMAVEVYYTAGD